MNRGGWNFGNNYDYSSSDSGGNNSPNPDNSNRSRWGIPLSSGDEDRGVNDNYYIILDDNQTDSDIEARNEIGANPGGV